MEYEKYKEQLVSLKGIKVLAIPLYNCISTGIKADLPVLFQIMAGQMNPITPRRAINLAIVLDRSGSMKGTKIENSKNAIKQLMEQLGPNDHLHIIIYNETVDTVLENLTTNDSKDFAKIDSIEADGLTNLLAGVEKSVELVRKYSSPNIVDSVMLFSDGLANRGIVDPERIGSKIKDYHRMYNINFTTFGIGSDFNEKLLSSIARCGKGYYFYIDNEEKIASLVQKAYNGIANIVAENLSLLIRGVNGSTLTKLEGCTDLSQGREFQSIREYGFHQLLANVFISGDIGDFSLMGEREILKYRVTFTDLETSRIVTIEDSVKITLSEDFEKPTASPEVVCYQTMLACGELNNKITEYVRHNRQKEAIELKEKVIEKYKGVVELDKYGFIEALLKRERYSLMLLEREGITSHSAKHISYTSSAPGRRYERNLYESNEEEDTDMGFGFFS